MMWGGAAGTFFAVDGGKDGTGEGGRALVHVVYTQTLDYHVGAPQLRGAVCRKVYDAIAHDVEPADEGDGGDGGGFTG